MGRLRQAKLALPGVIDPNQAIFGRRVLGAGGHQPDADPALRQMEPNRRGCLTQSHSPYRPPRSRRSGRHLPSPRPSTSATVLALAHASPLVRPRATKQTVWFTSWWQQRRDPYRPLQPGSRRRSSTRPRGSGTGTSPRQLGRGSDEVRLR